jgi:hypothetical protein
VSCNMRKVFELEEIPQHLREFFVATESERRVGRNTHPT